MTNNSAPELSTQIGFFVPVFDNEDIDKLLQLIKSYFSKSNMGAKFVLLSNNQNIIDQLNKNSNIEEAKLQIVRLNSKRDLFTEALKNNQSKYICFLKNEDIQNASNISNWYAQNKNKLQEDTLYSILPAKKSKPSINAIVASAIMPIKAKTLSSKSFILHANTAASFLPALRTKVCDLPIELAYKAKVSEIKHEGLELKSYSGKAAKLNLFRIKYNYFATRFNWFVKLPIKQTFCNKTKKPISAWSGKHPIYRLLFFTLAIFALFFMPIISQDYGITWDEPEDHKYFEKVYNYHASGGEDKSCLNMQEIYNTHLIYYGPFANLACIVADRYISPLDTFETRHMVISLFGFLAMLFTGLLAKRLGNWQTGFIAFLFIFLTPFFFGSSMNNQKDIPFAAFYIISTYYIVLFIKQLPKPSFKIVFTLALTIGITLSIRIAGLLLIAYLGMFMAIFWIIYSYKHKLKKSGMLIPRFILSFCLISFVAYVLGIILWPYALQDPIKNPYNALTQFEDFSLVHIWELFEGAKTYMKDFPWYYLPKFMLITIPLFALSGILLALAGIKNLFKKQGAGTILIVFFILVFPVIYIIYKKSAVYSMWRHVYFVYPIIVVIAALGWSWAIERFKNKNIKILAAAVLALLLIKPTIWSLQNHPYQYIYYNELIGGVNGAYSNYETDYWCQSSKEAIQWIIENENIENKNIVVATNNELVSASYYANKLSDNIKIEWARAQEWNKKDWDYAIWTTRTLPKKCLVNGYFPPKGTIHTINVEDAPIAAIVKRENNSIYKAQTLIKKQKFTEAILELNNAIAYDNLNEEAYRTQGMVYLKLNDFQNSAKQLNKAIELYPKNAAAWYYIALGQFYQRQYDKAVYSVKKALNYKVSFGAAYSLLADTYFEKKEYYLAIKNYRKFMELKGTSANILNQIGVVYLELGNFNEAIKNFKLAIKHDYQMAEAYYNLGYSYAKLGDRKQSLHYYNIAKELMPDMH